MIYSPPHYSNPLDRSLYQGITGWASHASQRLLAGLTATGMVVGAAVVAIDWRRAPLAGLLLIAAAVGAWGLIEQRAVMPHSRLIRAMQGALVLLGAVGAVVAALALLFWVMGPAPVL
ncbi:MAG TPA: hypothetical protein VH764_04335 [Gemmatimonadales bacterium]|jgi:hypothetical protein